MMIIVSLLAIVMTALTPAAMIVLGLTDFITGYRRGRRVRIWLVLVCVCLNEAVGAVMGVLISMRFLGRAGSEKWLSANYRLERWWCRIHLGAIERFANIGMEFDNPEVLSPGNAIIVARHASHVDALGPLYACDVAGIRARYTLKQELQWLPAMDLIGNRTPNVWIDRAPQAGSPMLKKIENLAAGINETNAGVIFPEGTFFTPARLEKAAARLASTRPELEGKARQLTKILPPRPAGFLALLRGSPGADIVLIANVGLENGGGMSELLAKIDRPTALRMHAWRYPRVEVPRDSDDAVAWLLDRWIEMDQWIVDQAADLDAAPHGDVKEPQ
jgi:1-acyl-sn-glycerol-3-phosphate acyltransferase